MHEQQLVSAAQAVGLALAGDYFEEYVGQVRRPLIDMPCAQRWLPFVFMHDLHCGLTSIAWVLVTMFANPKRCSDHRDCF